MTIELQIFFVSKSLKLLKWLHWQSRCSHKLVNWTKNHLSEHSAGGLKRVRVQSSEFDQWLWRVTPKYLTGAFEGKCISCFGLKSGKHGNSSKYRGKNWKKKSEGIRPPKKKSQMSHRKQLATNTLLEQRNSLCPILKFYFFVIQTNLPIIKNGNFLVLYVLRYFATQNIKATHLQAVFKVLHSSLISVQHVCLMQSLHDWTL